MKKGLSNRRGEVFTATAVKVIIAVVVGVLILGGLFALYRNVIFPKLNQKVEGMIHTEDTVQVRKDGNSVQYTHDGVTWIPSEIPTYAKDAKVLTLASGGTADAPVTLCIIRSDNNVVALYSTDEGRSFREGKRWTFTGKYGARMKWNAENQRFEGEIRINQSGNLLWTKDGITWKLLNAPIHYFN